MIIEKGQVTENRNSLVTTMTNLKKLEEQVAAWTSISIHSHRFGGREFRFGNAEVGHAHTGGIIDIPFPRQVRDALLAEGLAEEHHWVPNSGWISFRVHSEKDLGHALWLLRLSYLRYALKKAANPAALLEKESEVLQLSPKFKTLFEKSCFQQNSPLQPKFSRINVINFD